MLLLFVLVMLWNLMWGVKWKWCNWWGMVWCEGCSWDRLLVSVLCSVVFSCGVLLLVKLLAGVILKVLKMVFIGLFSMCVWWML